MNARTVIPAPRPPRLRWLVLAAIIATAFLVNEVAGKSGLLHRREQQDRIAELQQELDQLRQENEYLAERVRRLHSNPDAIEELAREKLHLARPGELVVALSPPAPPDPLADASEEGSTGGAESGESPESTPYSE